MTDETSNNPEAPESSSPLSTPGNHRNAGGLLVSLLLAAGVAALAVTRRDQWLGALHEVDPGWLLAGGAVHLLNYGFRSLRIRSLHPGEIALWPTALRAMSIHGFFTYLLPLRAGDLTLPALLKNETGVAWREGFRMLVSVRFLDLCALGLWVTGSALFLQVGVGPGFRLLWLACGLAMALLPLWVRPLAALPEFRPRAVARLLRALGALGRVQPRDVFLSLLIWAAVGGCQLCVARALGIPLSPGDALFLVTVQLPLQLMPLQGLANAGNHEAGWVLALVLLGIGGEAALSFALSSHIILLGYVCALGLLGAVAGGIKPSGIRP